MTTDVAIPSVGESVTSANIARWHKSSGDPIKKGEIIVTLETDKISTEIEAPVDGTLEILIPENVEAPIGTVIATLESPDAPPPPRTFAPPPPKKSPTPEKNAPKFAQFSLAPEPERKAEPKSPAPTPRFAPTEDLPPVEKADTLPNFSAPDIAPSQAELTSTGQSNRITRSKMSMLRRRIATQLLNAQKTAAILTTFNEVDMSAVMNLRTAVQDEFMKKHGVKLGLMSFFVKAVTQALKDIPHINARIDGNDIIENHFFDVGIAINTEKGLVVPVLRDTDKKSFAQIEKEILAYASKAREGKITIADLMGGVFTISNGGTYGSLLSTPILNPPQSGILGMHTIQQRPVARDGHVVIRPMMYLALSYDHRLIDGSEAVTFLIRIKESLEAPARLMLEV